MNLRNNRIFVRELAIIRNIHLACKNCESHIADFGDVEHNSKFEWKLDTINLYWDNIIQFVGGEIYCECESHLGKIIENQILSLEKTNISLIY